MAVSRFFIFAESRCCKELPHAAAAETLSAPPPVDAAPPSQSLPPPPSRHRCCPQVRRQRRVAAQRCGANGAPLDGAQLDGIRLDGTLEARGLIVLRLPDHAAAPERARLLIARERKCPCGSTTCNSSACQVEWARVKAERVEAKAQCAHLIAHGRTSTCHSSACCSLGRVRGVVCSAVLVREDRASE